MNIDTLCISLLGRLNRASSLSCLLSVRSPNDTSSYWKGGGRSFERAKNMVNEGRDDGGGCIVPHGSSTYAECEDCDHVLLVMVWGRTTVSKKTQTSLMAFVR
jgi:hypothetical protein